MPIVTVAWKLKSQAPDKSEQSVRHDSPAPQGWIQAAVNEECVVAVELTRRSLQGRVSKILSFPLSHRHTHMHACTHIYVYGYTHTHTDMHTHTHTHIHTHTHTHTHAALRFLFIHLLFSLHFVLSAPPLLLPLPPPPLPLPLPPSCSIQHLETKAHSPRFPKAKDEGWWVLIGEVDTGELVALKRLGFIRGRTNITLIFPAPEVKGRKVYSLYLISDCYLGLDQQHEMHLDFVIPT